MYIPVVDIFAGPGGLGEGFSAYSPAAKAGSRPFRIAVSAEMEVNAAKTLRLRAFFRRFAPGHAPKSYYDYVAGRREFPWTEATKSDWEEAGREARQLTLGVRDDDLYLHGRIREVAKQERPWVLIGGPPCQAYSLVGRARNAGTVGYKPEEDHRHFLYTHYLEIVRKFRPAVFVMENVKGILSSKVGGSLMFPRILDDLQMPGGVKGPRYRIVPMTVPTYRGKEPSFLLRAEELGVPQARHRVVLLGIRDDVNASGLRHLRTSNARFGVLDAIGGLPRLRSGTTDVDISSWSDFAYTLFSGAGEIVDDQKVSERLYRLAARVKRSDPGSGGRWMPKSAESDVVPSHLSKWLVDGKLDGILNHEVRDHMSADIARYAFAAAFGEVHKRSPRGAEEFPDALHPSHANWGSGKFVDRFKVQIGSKPSSTVTSHLSKDGHYFIHPDASQMRSLSVREAARLQTFPDNYFFEGARGAQYRQVGNAVPPWMATQIADVVYSIFKS